MDGDTAVDDEELRCRLALARVRGLGPRSAIRLLDAQGSARAALRTSRYRLAELGLGRELAGRLAAPDWVGVDRDLDWIAGAGRFVSTFGSAGYPPALSAIPDPPPVLYVEGDVEALTWPQMAIVGARAATAAGRETAEAFGRAFVEAGLAVTSGLALGIDAAAHRGALEGGGPTVAVLGGGLDRIYPASHSTLAEAIVGDGALISEFPIGTHPTRRSFPQRNRVISGLSAGVLVVEASVRSGALVTAGHAIEQGRDVFAIPGSIHSALSRGCHRLIRHGAKLVETVEDVLEELAAVIRRPDVSREFETRSASGVDALDDDYRRLLDSVEYCPTGFDLLVARTGLTPAAVSSMLLALELQGYVESTPGGRYSRAIAPGRAVKETRR